MAKYLPQLLCKLLTDYKLTEESVYLDGVKIKLTWEGITIRNIESETQKRSDETWTWEELGYKRK
jgi:hypothetical protein